MTPSPDSPTPQNPQGGKPKQPYYVCKEHHWFDSNVLCPTCVERMEKAALVKEREELRTKYVAEVHRSLQSLRAQLAEAQEKLKEAERLDGRLKQYVKDNRNLMAENIALKRMLRSVTPDDALSSQPDLPLIEEVRKAVEFAIDWADYHQMYGQRDEFRELRARLNPRK